MKLIKRIIDSLNYVISPPICILCSNVVDIDESYSEHICNDCLLNLPKPLPSDEVLQRINKLFGKDNNPFDFAFSLYNSGEHSKYLDIIHYLKYTKFTKIGYFLGARLGEIINQNLPYLSFQVHSIIPVPIHKVRERERGFNQAEIISRGISSVTNIPINKNVLKRRVYTESQTKLNLEERTKNVYNAFEIQNGLEKIKDRNFILVDDVITTGSTLYYCGRLLKENGAGKLVLAVLTTA